MSFVPALRVGSRVAASNLAKRSYSSAMSKEAIAAAKTEAATAVDTWKKITLFVTVPVCLIFGVMATKEEFEHIHHYEHHPPEHVNYSYLDIHHKDLPWGDGTKPLFYNPLFDRKKDE